jgi:hypothetical protein
VPDGAPGDVVSAQLRRYDRPAAVPDVTTAQLRRSDSLGGDGCHFRAIAPK